MPSPRFLSDDSAEIIEDDDAYSDEEFEAEVEALLRKGEGSHAVEGNSTSRPGSGRPQSARPQSARPQSARPGSARPASARPEPNVPVNQNRPDGHHTDVSEKERKIYRPPSKVSAKSCTDYDAEDCSEIEEVLTDSESLSEMPASPASPNDENFNDESYYSDDFDINQAAAPKQSPKHSPKHSPKQSPKQKSPQHKSTKVKQQPREILKSSKSKRDASPSSHVSQSKLQETKEPVKAKQRLADKSKVPKTSFATSIKNAAAAAGISSGDVSSVKARPSKKKVRPHSAQRVNPGSSVSPPSKLRPTSAPKSSKRKTKPSSTSLLFLKKQNNKLKLEVKRLKRAAAVAQKRKRSSSKKGEGANATTWSTSWSQNVPLISPHKALDGTHPQRDYEFGNRNRPGESEILFKSIMNEQERRLWMNNIGNKKKVSKARLQRHAEAIREAMWNPSTVISNDEREKVLAIPFPGRRKSLAKSTQKVMPGKSRAKIVQAYREPNAQPKKVKRNAKKGRSSKKTSRRVHAAEIEEFDKRFQSENQNGTSASPKEKRTPPIDWSVTDLYLNSASRLRQAYDESSQVESLLAAIDDPDTVEAAYESGCQQLKTLWEELLTSTEERNVFKSTYFGHASTGNFTHVLSQVTRLTNLRNKFLQTFEIIKRRERLVSKLAGVLDPAANGKKDVPKSPKNVTAAADRMVELRTLNEGLLATIEELEEESRQPLVLYGLKYTNKIKFDLVLP